MPPASKSRNKNVPKSWLNCSKISCVIESTRFIAFKSPINQEILKSSNVPENKWFTVDQLIFEVESLGYRIGLLINLSGSSYYDDEEIKRHHIKYVNLRSRISRVEDNTDAFIQVVNTFLSQNKDERTLIGVHCLHGLNRTGYLICAYMVGELGISSYEAICRFETARGESMSAKCSNAVLALQGNGP